MIEYVKQGSFYADEWSMSSDSMTASVSARDGTRDSQDQALEDGVFWRDYTAGQAVADLAKISGIGGAKVRFNDTYERTVLRDGPVQYVRMNLPVVPKVVGGVADWWGRFWSSDIGNYQTLDTTINPEYEANFTTINITNFSFSGVSTYWNARFESFVTFDFSETYTIRATHNDGVRVYVNGLLVLENWNVQNGNTVTTGTFAATAGTSYYVVVEHFLSFGNERLQLEWSSTSVPQAVIPASKAVFSNPMRDLASNRTQRTSGDSSSSLLASDKDDKSILYDGTSHFGVLNVDGLPTTQKATFEFWFNNTQSGTADSIAFDFGSGSNRVICYASANTGTTTQLHVVGATGTATAAFPQPSRNVSHHYVYQCDKSTNPDTIRLWVDGVEQVQSAGASVDNSDNINNGILYLMSSSVPGSFTPGFLDEFAVYPYLLTQAQITAHYNAGVAGQQRTFPLLYEKGASIWDAQLNFSTADYGMFYLDEDDNFIYESFTDFYNAAMPQHSVVQYDLSDSQEIVGGEQTVELQVNKVIVNINPPTTLNTGTQPIWRASNNESLVVTELTASALSVSNTMAVKSTNSPLWKKTGYFKIDNEIMSYTGITSTSFTGVLRGQLDTLAVAHSSGAKVREVRVYDIEYSNYPASSVESQPLITANDFEDLVDIDSFTHTPYAAKIVVSAAATVPEGETVFLEGTDPETKLNYFFALAGTPVAEDSGNEKVVKQVAQNSDNIRKYKIKDLTFDNKFIQDKELATTLAAFILTRYQNPVPIIELDIMCIPHLQLGDRVRVLSFAQLDIVSRDYWVIKISTSYDGGANQKVTLREVS